MAKRREKKKVKSIKKNYGIHVKKELINPMEMYIMKESLFESLPMDVFNDELKKNGIIINDQEIIKEYQNSHNYDGLLDLYHERYKDELATLALRGELFDDDCILIYLKRLIVDNFDTWKLSDPDFIVEKLDKMNGCSLNFQKMKILDILASISKIKEYYHENNLSKVFESSYYDWAKAISDIYDRLLDNGVLKKSEYEKHYQLLKSIIDNYECDGAEAMILITTLHLLK